MRLQCFTGLKHAFNSSTLFFDDAGISGFQSYLKLETTPLCQDGENVSTLRGQNLNVDTVS